MLGYFNRPRAPLRYDRETGFVQGDHRTQLVGGDLLHRGRANAVKRRTKIGEDGDSFVECRGGMANRRVCFHRGRSNRLGCNGAHLLLLIMRAYWISRN